MDLPGCLKKHVGVKSRDKVQAHIDSFEKGDDGGVDRAIAELLKERQSVVAKILDAKPGLMVALKDSHGKTTEAKKPSYGSQNKLVSSDRAAELRAKLREKLSNLNSGIDPEMLAIGTELAAYHIEAGARSFADFASAIFADLADLAPKASPYIKTWYMGAKMLPGMDKTGMDSEATVNSLDENDFIGSYEETVDTFDANPDTDIKELNLTDGGNKDERGGIAGTGEASLGEVVSTDGEGNEGEGLLRPLDAGGSEKGGLPDKPVDESGVSTARSGRGSSKGRNPDTTRKPGRKGGVAEEPARPENTNIPGANFVISEDVRLGQGGETEKFNDNIRAIETLKQIERDGRRATPEEQKVLARYVGWGGLANAFANPTTGEVKKGWEDRAAKLSGMLDDKELAAARNSTQNAHYTSPTVVSAVWDAVRHLGYRTGIALEPSVGTGNFLGLAPEDMRSTKFVGVEYDSLTARIAGALYPQASIIHSGLEKVPVPEGSFDLVIGNPPFGKTSLSFSYSPEISRYSIHNQFFLAGVKALKPGGIQAMVVSRYLLDAVDSTSRTAIAKHARLLGAIRLPDSAFKENARTEVVTDIIFLQRLTPEEETAQEELAITPSWIETTKVPDPLGGDPINVNSYFAENKKAIIGTLERSGSMQHGADVTVRLDKSEDFAKLLSQSIKDVLPKSVAHNRYAGDGIDQRFESMRTGLEIAMAGHEPGSVSINKDGKLEHIFEREQENGQWAMTRRILSADSPWSQQLSMDKDGNWFREVPKLDKDGNKAKDGKRNVYVREVFTKESDIPASLRMGQLSFDKLKYLSTIRDFLMKQINLEMNDEPDAVIESNRTELKKKYDEFVGKYGLISDSKNAKVVSEMPDEGRIMSLEHSFKKGISKLVAEKTRVKPREATAKQAAILSERVAFKPKLIETADSPGDAVLISLAESGSIDMDRISELLGVSKDEAIDKLHDSLDVPLVFKNPESGSWEHADEYLSGQVVRKLEAAKQAGISKNVRSLEKVVPEQWGPENITAVIGSTWVSPSDYEEFLKHLTGEKAKVSYSKISNSYSIEGSLNSVAGAAWRTEDASTAFLVDALLNSGSVNIYWKDEDGKRHLNQEASELAAMKAQEIESEFSDWAFSDSDRRNRLVKRFNDRYNTRVPRQRDGSHMTLPGKVPDVIIKLRRHQMNAVWRGVMDRFTLYDHAVGAGKSFTAIARAMERKRMGISRKPMIVVPNHLVEQFAADVYRLYPGANVLSAGNKDFAKKNRRRLFAKIATGNWDIVVVPHSSFKAIGISGEAEQRFLDQDLAKAMEAVNEAEEQAMEDGEDQGFRKPHTVKMAEAMVTTITGKIDKLKSKTRDGLLSFEQLGIDDLTVDEAHEFKNLWYSSRQSVRGMNPKLGSEKAFDLYNKVRVLRESPTGSVTFMTGTPISNSAVEMYGMMRYLAADELQELGLDHFDAWRAQYTSVSSKFEPTESGNSLKEVKRLGRDWVNMRSLMDFYYSFTDCVTNEDIKKWYKEDNNGEDFPIPKVKGGERQAFVVPPTPAQQLELAEVIQGFKDLPAEKNPKVRNGDRLRLMDRARKISLDARAVNPHNPSKEEGGKLEKISDETYKIYQEWNKDLGTQLIFLDRSIPRSSGDAKELKAYDDLIARMDAAGNDEDLARSLEESLEKYNPQEMEEMRNAQAGGWNAYQQLKDNLIAKGVPEKEIRFIQDASTELQKKELFEMVNSGEVRILIGSTPKMGAGTNVQERLVAIHHGDVTWKPSDIEQREGRIIRQGNKLLGKYGEKFEVIIQAYVTERTIDSKLWDLNATKLKMINGIRHYNGEFTMEFEDEDSVGMAEIAAIASGNPLQLERVKLAAEIDRLDRAGKAHQRQIYAAQGNLENAKRIAETYPDRVKEGEERNKTISDALAEKKKNIAERSIVINGKTYTMSSKWDAWTLLKVLKEEGNGHGKKKDTFIVGIDGKAYSSFTKASEVLESRLGDTFEFLATMGGTAYIARVDLARAIAKASNEKTKSMKDGDEAVIGTYQSDGAEITLEASAYFVNETIGLAISLSATSRINGKLVGHEVRDIGLPGNATAVNTKPLVGTIDKVTSDSRDDYDIDKEHLENAINGIPEYEKLAKRTFPKAEELETKRTRLQEVIRELAAAESTSGVVDQVDAVQLITQLEGRPLLSSSKATSTGNTIESVISELRDFIGAGYANLVRRGKLEIVRTEAGLPENVRKNGEPLYSKDGTIAGAYYKGVTYLVADSIRKGDVKNIFVHEALHANFREDKRFMSQKAKILADFSALTSQEAVDARAKVPKDTPAELVDEEGLAYMVQANPKHSLVRRIIAAVKAALFRLGIPVGKLNEADLVALFTQGAKSFSKQGGAVKESLTTGDYATAFAKQYGISVAESQKQYADAVKQYGADAWKKAKADAQKEPTAFDKKFDRPATTAVNDTGKLGVYEDPALLAMIKIGKEVTLESDNNDKFDSTAVKVMIGDKQIGFVNRQDAPFVQDMIDDGVELNASISFVTGYADKPIFNIRIRADIKKMSQGQLQSWKNLHHAKGKESFEDAREAISKGDMKAAAKAIEQAAIEATTADIPGEGWADKAKRQIRGIKEDKRSLVFGAFSLQQLDDMYGEEFPPVRWFYKAATSISAAANGMLQEADKLHRRWSKLDKKSADAMAEVMHKATIAGVDPDMMEGAVRTNKIDKDGKPIERFMQEMNLAELEASLKGKRAALRAAKGLHGLSTQSITKKFIEEVGILKRRVDDARELTPMFAALSKDAKEVYREVRDMHTSRLNRMQDAIIAQIEKTMTGKAKKDSLAMIRAKFEVPMEGPYFPLSRFGDHVVIAEGKNGERAVSTFEHMAEAERFARVMRVRGYDARIKKAKEFQPGDQAPAPFAQDVINILNSEDAKMDPKVRKELIDQVNQAFIKALPDMSHRKHFIHRKGTAGYSRDAMRSFAAASLHSAKHIARIEHGGDLTAAISDLSNGDYSANDQAATIEMSLRNELGKRQQLIMSPNVHPVAQMLTGFGFVMNIGPSIASAMVNLTQTPFVAYPVIASRFGFKRAGAALMQAVNDYRKADFSWEAGLNLEHAKFLSEGERGMIGELIKRGTLDVSQAHSIAAASSTDYLALSESGEKAHKYAIIMKAISWPFHVAEVANRQITALAAYRLAIAGGHDAALEYAEKAVNDGHFDYSEENRARHMQGNVARVALLFKQYSQNITYLLGRNFLKAIGKAGVSPEEVRRAKVQFAGIIGGHFLVTGALGMPVLGLVGGAMNILAGMFGDDDDEPWDYKVEMRKALADIFGNKAGEIIAHGPARLLPIDVASRLSLSDLWWRGGDRPMDGREAFAHTMQNIAGPVAANAASMFMGAGMMADGEVLRGVEMMLPKAAKDVLKTIRYANEGVTNTKHDELIADIDGLELFGQLLGFTPARVAEMYEGKNAVKNMETKLDDRRGRLRNDYVKARLSNDAVGVAEAMEDIKKWNRAHAGNKSLILTYPSLMQSVKARKKVRANTKDGIYMPTKRDWLREEGRFATGGE